MKTKKLTDAQKSVRDYLAEIGHRGGVMSRRLLTRKQARQMVSIREIKRQLIKQGKIAEAMKRQPLPREKKRPPPERPAVRPTRWIANPKAWPSGL